MIRINEVITINNQRLMYWGVNGGLQLEFYNLDTKQTVFFNSRPTQHKYEELDF